MPALIKPSHAKLRKEAEPHLRRSETLQQVFAGDVVSQHAMGDRHVLNVNKFQQRTFAVTSERILVLGKGGVVAELPRGTHFIPKGGLKGLVNFTVRFAYGETVTFGRVWFSDIVAAEGREGEPHSMWARRSA